MDMTQYFNKYNQYHTIPHNYIFLISGILIITYGITRYLAYNFLPIISLKYSIEHRFALVCTFIMFCFIMFIAAGLNYYKDHSVVKPFIQDVQSEINKKLNVKITYQQTEKLLEEQPLWANHLTKKDLDNKR